MEISSAHTSRDIQAEKAPDKPAAPAGKRRATPPRRGPSPAFAALWMILAAAAIGSTGYVAASREGTDRLAQLFTAAANRQAMREEPVGKKVADLQAEVVRLQAEVRRTAMEKVVLNQRIAALENDATPATTASIPSSPGNASDSTPARPIRIVKEDPASAGGRRVSGPGSASNLMKTAFAIQVGTAANMAELKDRWAQLSQRHGPDFGALEPLVAVREMTSGDLELLLLAGPIGNAADAIRLCARIRDIGTDCTPVPYEGQRLAMH